MSGSFRFGVFRPDDLLVLEFEFHNVDLADDGRAVVPHVDPGGAFAVVRFPPQAIAEEVWDGPVARPPIRTALSGPTRLVFRLPTTGAPIPLTVEGLLDWKTWEPALSAAALPRGTEPGETSPELVPPDDLETAIEFPHRLQLSPDALGQWRTLHGTTDVEDVHQLWSAVLCTQNSDGSTSPGADVRALADRTGPTPFISSLTEDERHEIVQLSSNFRIELPPAAGVSRYRPVPIKANRLELTALGANADLESEWEFPLLPPEELQGSGIEPLGLRQYQHVATLGRDHFVRTVRLGFLCGTGHRAVLVKTVERLPDGIEVVGQAPGGGALFSSKGYLLRKLEVVVQEPVINYGPLAKAYAYEGREFPLSSIRLTTTSAVIYPWAEGDGPFWLLDLERNLLRFNATGTDLVGSALDFTLPLMFVPYDWIDHHRTIAAVFHNQDPGMVATIGFSGRHLAVAPPGDRPGSTVLKVDTIRYDIEQPPHTADPAPDFPMNAAGAPRSYIPRFLPRVASITASIPAVDDLLGTGTVSELVPDPDYLKQGFDNAGNPAQTFVRMRDELPIALPSQRGGGLASPAQNAKALSRTLGPVSSPEQLQQGKLDLSAFKDTKFLGTIRLLDLLPADLPFDGSAAAAAAPPSQAELDNPQFKVNPPRLTSRRIPAATGAAPTVESRFIWKPTLLPEYDFGFLKIGMQQADLLLDATTLLTQEGEGGAVVIGRLRNIELTFAEALSAVFGTLSFRAEAGRKMEVGAKDVKIAFAGPLEFVNALQSILPSDGFDDPPFLTVDSQGVVAGYTLGVPSIGVGIFSIQNIALTAALSIPFTDRPAGVRFAVCERHKPFLLTVSLFGGGGFFAAGVSANGLEQVEASLEFGGNISLNLGVASGGVSVMAGIYFGLTGTSVTLTGYLRCGGYLDVLGLISISLEFYLAFTFRKKDPGSEVWGQASLTVSVKIAFISKSISLSVERRFAGSGGDPTFAQSVRPSDWVGYLQAFA
ncbi:hypothetical protein [Arthrobacter sp. VKM Ac-2550]|uniref:hypothetical protein n=1 Tax=Crystallibacter permensis TaxID=1938888 RepID=UPI002225F1DF|nr:hypothetical protein [Arthrobacter sp. VKM Ac-2550]MCW2131658.1 hypothetical protein [Arthrobacter sp. VKM Ac-2550]